MFGSDEQTFVLLSRQRHLTAALEEPSGSVLTLTIATYKGGFLCARVTERLPCVSKRSDTQTSVYGLESVTWNYVEWDCPCEKPKPQLSADLQC